MADYCALHATLQENPGGKLTKKTAVHKIIAYTTNDVYLRLGYLPQLEDNILHRQTER